MTADDGIRTRDLRFTKPLLYQLSYVGASGKDAIRRLGEQARTCSPFAAADCEMLLSCWTPAALRIADDRLLCASAQFKLRAHLPDLRCLLFESCTGKT